MSTDRELRACPFQHPINNGVVVKGDKEAFYVACKDCGAEGPPYGTERHAIEGWNTRPLRPEGGVREAKPWEKKLLRIIEIMETFQNADFEGLTYEGQERLLYSFFKDSMEVIKIANSLLPPQEVGKT